MIDQSRTEREGGDIKLDSGQIEHLRLSLPVVILSVYVPVLLVRLQTLSYNLPLRVVYN